MRSIRNPIDEFVSREVSVVLVSGSPVLPTRVLPKREPQSEPEPEPEPEPLPELEPEPELEVKIESVPTPPLVTNSASWRLAFEAGRTKFLTSELAHATLRDLRALCGMKGISARGRKAELAARLVDYN